MRSLSTKLVLLALISFALPSLCRAAGRTDGGVPKLDVTQSCRQAQTIGGDDKNLAFKGCMQDEKDAQDQLAQRWSHYKAEDRRNCIEQGAAPMPSYVEILTCIEMYDNSSTFNRPVTDSGSLGAPAAPTASPSPSPPNASAPADSGQGLKF